MTTLLLALAPVLLAAEPAEAPQVTTTGIVFARYGYDLTEGADGANAFGVDRAYVGVVADLDPKTGLARRIAPVRLGGGLEPALPE